MTSLLAIAAATGAATAHPATGPVSFADIEISKPAEPADDSKPDDDIIVTGQRTEGTDDYAVKTQTTATRLPLSLRETPQSVSVVTRAQIEDFQLNDVNALLTTVPGITVQASETDRINYTARGFEILTFQIDGIGLPFAFEIETGSIDTAIYDHIEVVKGAPGLLSPTGNPSAVVNFIRKRPGKTTAAAFNVQYGSNDWKRADVDVSVPLTRDGALRARGVGVYQDNASYLDRYKLRRWTGYGILEADLGPATTASAGYGHQDHQSTAANWGALPLVYTDGTRVPYRRSANSGTNWAGWGVIDRQIFGDITHHFNDDWLVKVSAQRRAIGEDDQLFYVYGNPDRATGNGIFSYPGAFRAQTRNLTLDAYVSGKVGVLGRQHDVMLGVNRGAQQYKQYSSYDAPAINQPVSLDELLAGTFPKPNFPAVYDLSLDTHTRREAVYGLLRLNLADPLKVMAGGTYTHARSEGESYGSPTNYNRKKFTPFVGATLDLTSSVSAYASYASIFNPQTAIGEDGQIVDPLTGSNIEGGLKGEWFGGRLNASLAVFEAKQKNVLESVFSRDFKRFVSRAVDAKSQGIEAEIAGELAPGLRLTGGYTLMLIRGPVEYPIGSGELRTRNVRTYVPRNNGRLNVSYAPPALPAVKVGASLQYQSRIYLEPRGAFSTTTNDQIRITQGGYALLDLFARYNVTEQVSLGVNVKNVTDKKYLNAVNYDQSYFGAPRQVLGTLSFRY